ncbi:MAG: CHAT domain-containing protein [Thermoanaerobaculia bacterium]|nr:MAG: CHAT domain-containing protein [Thermoanaerobaculia bacterium]
MVRGALGAAAWPLARLPASEGEAAAIAELFGESAVVFAGREASEERFKSRAQAGAARYLHVAAHGLVSEEFPHLSGLALALRAGGSEDGLLQAHEIAKLRLDADLVVLSACQTGLGREVRGEGLVGLSQAFFQAGARGLVVSLWNVADASTARLMRSFYRRLAAGAPASEALRGAQLEQLDEGNPHPYYWAPFVVVGAD